MRPLDVCRPRIFGSSNLIEINRYYYRYITVQHKTLALRLFQKVDPVSLSFLSADNPLRSVLTLEQIYIDSKTLGQAALNLGYIMSAVKQSGLDQLDPHLGIYHLHALLETFIHARDDEGSALFFEMLTHADLELDAYGYTLLYLSIAHELGWKLKIVVLPEHIYVRVLKWDGAYMNFDPLGGFSCADENYAEFSQVDLDYIEHNTLEHSDFLALAYYRRGLWHEKSGNLPATLSDFRFAAQWNPNDFSVLQKLGECYYQNGDMQNAYETLSQAALQAPEHMRSILDNLLQSMPEPQSPQEFENLLQELAAEFTAQPSP